MGDNVVYVGDKPVMDYVTAVMMQFNESDSVTIKARGRAISRAVDCAEIARNRFVPDSEITKIETGTETVTDEEGRERNLSTISIEMAR